MLLTLQNTFIKAPPSAIDSLHHSVLALQHQVDSLQKIVTKTEIGTGFFSDVISQNLYTYAIIIGLLALVSWGSFIGAVHRYKTAVERKTKLQLRTHSEKHKKISNKLKFQQRIMSYNINRSMYASVSQLKLHDLAFSWAMATIGARLKFTNVDHADLKFWIGFANEELEKVPGRSKELVDNEIILKKIFKKILLVKNEDTKKIVISMLATFNDLVHSKAYSQPGLFDKIEDAQIVD